MLLLGASRRHDVCCQELFSIPTWIGCLSGWCRQAVWSRARGTRALLAWELPQGLGLLLVLSLMVWLCDQTRQAPKTTYWLWATWAALLSLAICPENLSTLLFCMWKSVWAARHGLAYSNCGWEDEAWDPQWLVKFWSVYPSNTFGEISMNMLTNCTASWRPIYHALTF